MPTSNRLSLIFALIVAVLAPLIFTSIALSGLSNLHIPPDIAWKLLIGIVLGGLINIPIKRTVRDVPVWTHALTLFGIAEAFPRWATYRHESIIAVNVGGCLIPVGIAIYELSYLIPLGSQMIWAVTIATAINTVVCYAFATPIPKVGIVMPGFIAPLTAVLAAVVLAPEQAAPVAFVAGVLGPLIGADFLHIDAFTDTPVGVASIGGAGTFDGIVLSGILAAFLARDYGVGIW